MFYNVGSDKNRLYQYWMSSNLGMIFWAKPRNVKRGKISGLVLFQSLLGVIHGIEDKPKTMILVVSVDGQIHRIEMEASTIEDKDTWITALKHLGTSIETLHESVALE